jgi:hypothetical protein
MNTKSVVKYYKLLEIFLFLMITIMSCTKNKDSLVPIPPNYLNIKSIKNVIPNSVEVNGSIVNSEKLNITDYGILIDSIGDKSRFIKYSIGKTIRDSVNFIYRIENLKIGRNYSASIYYEVNNISTQKSSFLSFSIPDFYKDSILKGQIVFFPSFVSYPSQIQKLCSTNNLICGSVNTNGFGTFTATPFFNSVKSMSFIFVNDITAIGDIIKFTFSDNSNMNISQSTLYVDKKNYTFAIGQFPKTVNVFNDSLGVYLVKKQLIYFTINCGTNSRGPELYINGNQFKFPIGSAGTIEKAITSFSVNDMMRVLNLQFHDRALSINEIKYLSNVL